MADHLFAVLDWVQGRLWRVGIRFQWPCWLLDWAWSRQATPYVPSAEKAVRTQLEAMPDA